MGIVEAAAALALKKRTRVWAKGRVIPDFDPAIWRWDDFGTVIKWDQYGNRNSDHGWEIDHIVPDCLDGPDEIHNLRPLNWRNNAKLGGLIADWLSDKR